MFNSDLWKEVLLFNGCCDTFCEVIQCSKTLYNNLTDSNYLMERIEFIVSCIDNIPKYVKNLKIYLDFNQKILKKLPKDLTILNIKFVGDKKYIDIGNLPKNLTKLTLDNCDDILHIENLCEQIKELNLIDINTYSIDQELIDTLPKLKNLETFYIKNTYLHDTLKCSFLKYLPSTVTTLKVEDCSIYREHLEYISKDLKNLSLKSLKIVSYEYIREICYEHMKFLPKDLISLNLFGTNMTNVTMKYIKENLINLEELDISYSWIDDDGMKYLPKNLKKLYVSYNQISEKYLKSLHPNLEVVIGKKPVSITKAGKITRCDSEDAEIENYIVQNLNDIKTRIIKNNSASDSEDEDIEKNIRNKGVMEKNKDN